MNAPLDPSPDDLARMCGAIDFEEREEPGSVMIMIAAWVISMTVVAACALVASVVMARAHDALPTAAQPQGWKSDFRCCADFDCYPVQTDAIRETPNGYQIDATGETIPYQSKKVLPSPDGLPYRCSVGGKTEAATICIYVPRGGV